MPLTDLIRTLNASQHLHVGDAHSGNGLDQPFVAAGGRAFLHYSRIRLESEFVPIIETASGALHGHAATLQCFGLSNGSSVSPEAVFVLPTDDGEFIYLDRLVRTLHALNYLTRPVRGNLLLQVHARHILSVPANHGLAFEEILRPCGLLPEQITLEFDPTGIDDLNHLLRAVDNYRSRGYGIAISHFGRYRPDFELLRVLRPDIVKLDRLLLLSDRPLDRTIAILQELPSKVLLESSHGSEFEPGDDLAAVDLLQGLPLQKRLHTTPEPITPFEPLAAEIRNAA